MKTGLTLVVLGFLVSSCSIALACLDSKDFFSALFADRGLERIGLGIQGLQLFHYLTGGIMVSALGGTLLVAKKNRKNPLDPISLDSHGSAAFSDETMKRLEVAIDGIARTEEIPDLSREATVSNRPNSGKREADQPPASEGIRAKSTDLLIDNATSLLPNEALAERDSSKASR